MKIKNFKRAFNHVLLNVPESEFSMNGFRKDDRTGYITKDTPLKCNTVGCIIGHCTALVKSKNFYKFEYFVDWSRYFFGIKEEHERLWDFCFSECWSYNDSTSSKTQDLLRIQYVIENKNCPENFCEYDYIKFVMPEKELKPYEI